MEVGRGRGFKVEAVELGGVDELELEGVEGLAVNEGGGEIGFGGGFSAGVFGFGGGFYAEVLEGDGLAAVGGVSDDGVSEVHAVDADLVGASGFGGEFEEGVAAEAFFDGVDGLGGFAGGVGADGVFFADFGVDAEGSVDEVGVEVGFTVDEGEVGFADGASFELAGDAPMGFIGFGDEDEAGGVAIEAVDDAGAPGVGAGGEGGVGILGVVDEGVDEGAGPVSAGGVNDEVGLFIDGEEGVIFVDDVEGNIFGEEGFGDGDGEGDVDGVAGAEEGGGFGGVIVDEDVAGPDEFLEGGAGGVGEAVAEVEVDAFEEIMFDFVVFEAGRGGGWWDGGRSDGG